MENDEAILLNDSSYIEVCDSVCKGKAIIKRLSRFLYKIFKRTLDVIISLVGIVFLLPFMLIVKIAFLLTGDKDTILFSQPRTGKNGKNFNLLKFRSMKINNDVRDFSKEDEFTKIGKFLRRTSLDELPQIINILRGEMSFIGPRPWIPEYYENMNENQRMRVSVLPGITGLAQVSGRNSVSVIDKINYDLYYVKHFGIIQDINVLWKTIATVFKKEHAYISKMGIHEEIEELKRTNNSEVKKKNATVEKAQLQDIGDQVVTKEIIANERNKKSRVLKK